ncbi:MAG TPA: PmoA family protein [Terracidiphilus sp.]
MAVIAASAAGMALAAGAFAAPPAAGGVQVLPDVTQHRVTITIDGKPFTSYIWPTEVKKPVLYPIVDADGVTVTRGFPLDPKTGERTDHPHHVGLWFNYSNVNGFDFWNNSDAIKAERRQKMGSIEFKKIDSAKSGANRGELTTESTWVTGAGDPILDETTHFVFARGANGTRIIDRTATLHALAKSVFHDDKDGLLGLRVASWLESPTAEGGEFRDASGAVTKVAGASKGASGEYLTSEGVKGDAAWGTRGKWCALTGHTDGQTVTVAIFDDAKNPGYPTYWHARGYGLFAANPLGRDNFDKTQPAFNYTLEKGQTAVFRYRVAIYTHAATSEELNREWAAFEAK